MTGKGPIALPDFGDRGCARQKTSVRSCCSSFQAVFLMKPPRMHVVAATTGLWNRERRRKAAEAALLKSDADLKWQTEELRLHREHLVEMVEERTQDLRGANIALQSEIVERKFYEEGRIARASSRVRPRICGSTQSFSRVAVRESDADCEASPRPTFPPSSSGLRTSQSPRRPASINQRSARPTAAHMARKATTPHRSLQGWGSRETLLDTLPILTERGVKSDAVGQLARPVPHFREACARLGLEQFVLIEIGARLAVNTPGSPSRGQKEAGEVIGRNQGGRGQAWNASERL